jgi:hypothetical protein
VSLDNLVNRGLQREPTDAAEIARFLAKVGTKLADSTSRSISLDSRFDLAYEAILQLGLTALRANGLRPDSRGGHHILALQTLDTSIGFPKEQLRVIDQFRRRRAEGLYDDRFDPSEAEANALIEMAQRIKVHLETWLTREHPEWGV